MLEIDLKLLFITIAIFLYLIAFLNKILYKPMLNFMEDRENSIKEDEELSSKNSSEVGIYEAQVEEMIINARNEANKIRQKAYEEIKIKNQKSIEEAKKEIENDFCEYMKDLKAQKESLKSKLKENLPQFRSGLEKTLAKI